jgi:DNA repair ATPase RecN
MPDEACRLAKVEQRIENLEEIFEDRGKKLDAIIATLDEMKTEQTRYKGFVGGIVFTIGAVFSFVTWWLGNR